MKRFCIFLFIYFCCSSSVLLLLLHFHFAGNKRSRALLRRRHATKLNFMNAALSIYESYSLRRHKKLEGCCPAGWQKLNLTTVMKLVSSSLCENGRGTVEPATGKYTLQLSVQKNIRCPTVRHSWKTIKDDAQGSSFQLSSEKLFGNLTAKQTIVSNAFREYNPYKKCLRPSATNVRN